MYSVLKNITAAVSGLLLPAVLFVSGAYFLFRIGAYVFSPRFLKASLVSGDKKEKAVKNEFVPITERESSKNSTRSPFSSLCLALAGTLGVGNISGVTAAVIIGGPGTVFWIWVCAIVSAVLKYAETVLAVHFQQRDPNGKPYGGAHLYIKNGLRSPKLSAVFCILCVLTSFTMGSITQTKAASDAVFVASGMPPAVCGGVFLIIVLYLSLGGGERISRLTLRLIPPLCLGYVCLSLGAIFVFRENILPVTKAIISEAFTARAGALGFLGFLSSPAMRYGVTRGIMSNEAGCGTAPIAYARSETGIPTRQGVCGIIEVLCDTLVLCTLTAYVVLLSETALIGSATEVAISSFVCAFGKWVRPMLGISIFLFALGSVAGWSFYGQASASALGCGSKMLKLYGVLFAVSAFLGCIIPENAVWELADLSISLMAIINVSAVLLLSPTVVRITREFYDFKRPPKRKEVPKTKLIS